MRFKELLKDNPLYSNIHNRKNTPASEIGTSRFGRDIFNIQERTPNWEMREIIEIIETRPHVTSGMKQIVRFILGNEINIFSEDQRTVDYMKKWIDARPNFYPKIFNLSFLAIGLGNSYMEPLYKEEGGKLKFHDFDIVPDPSRMYKYLHMNMNPNDDYWLYEVPMEIKWFEGKKPRYYRINYVRGGALFKQSVYAIPYSKAHFDHLKMGWSRDGLYGRGYLASTIDDNNILKEILKNIAIIARYRALNTKLITPTSEEIELIEDDVNYIEQRLLTKRDEEHLVLNKALKVESLSNTNEYDTMSNEIDFLRKDISSGLVPNFITPWDADVNRATAGESKIPFALELDSMEKEIINFLNMAILHRLKKEGAPIADDATFVFGKVNMESYDTMVNVGMNLYSQGVISFNELREIAGFEKAKGGDKFSWEIQTQDGNSIFGSIAGKKPQQRVKASINEKFFQTFADKKPRTRICENCKHFMNKKKFCSLNNWPCESKDSCNRFESKENYSEKLENIYSEVKNNAKNN